MEADQRRKHARASRAGFTLVEVLAVVTLIALFAGAIGYAFLRGGGGTVGLQASQSKIASLITLVRGQAATVGRNAALFVHVDSDNPEKYLRFVVPAVLDQAGAWTPLSSGEFLTSGVYVVPSTIPGSAVETGADWSDLNSTILRAPAPIALLSASPEDWSGIIFTPRGTVQPTPSAGNLVLAAGRRNAPGTDPPFVFINPQNVRGVSVSTYGLTRVINEAIGF